jgi:hypothetical protein
LHDEDLQNLQLLPNTLRTNKSKKMLWVGDLVRTAEMKYTCAIYAGVSGREKPLGKRCYILEDNIKWVSKLEQVPWVL